jgi:two-component system sporulation sensor kinase A
MKIGEVSSKELVKQPSLFTRLSMLPADLLDWIGNQLDKVFIVWDENDRICFATETVEKLLGYEKEELIGIHWYEKFLPTDLNKIKQLLSTRSNEGLYLKVLRKDNVPVSVELHMKDFTDPGSRKRYFAASFNDLSTYEEVKEMMIQAKKMSTVGQLSASIAHEIRNPLTSIKGFLQLLQAGVDHKEEYYRIMADEIEKIETITTELLSISKPSTNKMQTEQVEELIKDVIVLLQSQARLKNIRIELEEPASAQIYCNRSEIKQILINIIKNAIEAMDEPGEIRLSIRTDKKHVTVNVKDEGIGVPQDLLQQLEVAFFTTKENGTGLGLNITKEILNHHGGSLNILRNETKGSTFQLIFPRIEN